MKQEWPSMLLRSLQFSLMLCQTIINGKYNNKTRKSIDGKKSLDSKKKKKKRSIAKIDQ